MLRQLSNASSSEDEFEDCDIDFRIMDLHTSLTGLNEYLFQTAIEVVKLSDYVYEYKFNYCKFKIHSIEPLSTRSVLLANYHQRFIFVNYIKKICIEIPLLKFTFKERQLDPEYYAKDMYIDQDYLQRSSNNSFKFFKRTIINQPTYII